MFSVRQKREISDAVQRILRATNHPELPSGEGEIQFHLHVDGAESWSWADIKNNGAVQRPGANPWNEVQDKTITITAELEGHQADPLASLDSMKQLSRAVESAAQRCVLTGANSCKSHRQITSTLVDRVATAMHPDSFSPEESWGTEARAAIREVAAWLDSNEGLPELATPKESDGWQMAADVLFKEAGYANAAMRARE